LIGLYLGVRKIELYGILFFLLITSCGVTKRHYRPGFYFPRHSSFQVNKISDEIELSNTYVLAMLPANISELEPVAVIVDEIKEIEPVEFLPKQKQPKPTLVYADNKEEDIRGKESTKEIEWREEPVSENNTELARWYAGRAMRYAIITLCFCWTGYALFIFGPLALNRAKHALFLNDEGDEQIKVKAQRAQKIVSFCFTLASIVVLLLITLLVLSL
jgi:hypothetical protein